MWVGIPNDDNPEVTRRASRPRTTPSTPRSPPGRAWCSSTRGRGSPAATAAGPSTWINPRDGQGKDVRAEDGFHLNTNGAEILAVDIAEVVKSGLRAHGAPI